MKPHLIAYCLDWHTNQSGAFTELLIDPLKPYMNIELVAWDGRSDEPLSKWKQQAVSSPIIFCQRPPPQALLEAPGARLIWIPMWDNVSINWASESWWAALPKTLRVVAFSDGVTKKSQMAGLPAFNLRYFKNPAEFEPAKWDNGRTLLYWNRTGLFGLSFLKKLCDALGARRLIFRGEIDPKIKANAAYHLPARLGKTIVSEIPGFESQIDYYRILKQCNIYLAPRAVEGVGLTFLEAMASGCAVLAYDAPTMNEYIAHGTTGYLFPAETKEEAKDPLIQRLKNTGQGWIHGKRDTIPSRPLYRVSDRQNWAQLERIDLETLGCAARQHQAEGFASWTMQIADYAHFVLDW